MAKRRSSKSLVSDTGATSINKSSKRITPDRKIVNSSQVSNPNYFKIIVFKVGNSIFQVPRGGFEIPGCEFDLPTNEDEPYQLQVDETCFKLFLRVMYPFDEYELTKPEWLGVLDLATEWKFEEIRNKAICALDGWVGSQSPKEAALFAKKYTVSSWLKAAYIRLLQQNPLTMTELAAPPALDWETMARLFCCRHSISMTGLTNGRHYSCAYCGSRLCAGSICYCPRQLEATVESQFHVEFASMVVATRESDPPLTVQKPRKSKVKGSRNGMRKEKSIAEVMQSIAELMTSTGVQDQDGRA